MSLFSDVTTLALRLAETGLTLGETALRTTQAALDAVTGSNGRTGFDVPELGPANVDEAVSDLANRTSRILYFTPPSPEALPAAFEDWMRAVQISFQHVNTRDALTMALRLPFALGTLFADAGIRGLKTLEVTGGSRYTDSRNSRSVPGHGSSAHPRK